MNNWRRGHTDLRQPSCSRDCSVTCSLATHRRPFQHLAATKRRLSPNLCRWSFSPIAGHSKLQVWEVFLGDSYRTWGVWFVTIRRCEGISESLPCDVIWTVFLMLSYPFTALALCAGHMYRCLELWGLLTSGWAVPVAVLMLLWCGSIIRRGAQRRLYLLKQPANIWRPPFFWGGGGRIASCGSPFSSGIKVSTFSLCVSVLSALSWFVSWIHRLHYSVRAFFRQTAVLQIFHYCLCLEVKKKGVVVGRGSVRFVQEASILKTTLQR